MLTGFQPRRSARPLLSITVAEVFGAVGVPRTTGPIIVKGAIVWLQPGPGDEDGAVDRAEAHLREWGAVRVKRLPRLAADLPIVHKRDDGTDGDATLRQVAMQLVDEADVPVREALRKIVSDALDKAGA